MTGSTRRGRRPQSRTDRTAVAGPPSNRTYMTTDKPTAADAARRIVFQEAPVERVAGDIPGPALHSELSDMADHSALPSDVTDRAREAMERLEAIDPATAGDGTGSNGDGATDPASGESTAGRSAGRPDPDPEPEPTGHDSPGHDSPGQSWPPTDS